MTAHALCMCCGSEYDSGGDCPNVQRVPHTLTRAVAVAQYLHEHGCDHARPLDVKQAVQALEAVGRV